MENIQEKMSDKFSKFQNKFDKEKGKIENIKEKSDINKDIQKATLRKSNILLDMGILLYEKIRKYEIEDEDFNEFCEEIILIDKEIYENEQKINKLKEQSKEKICECGHTLNADAKFCAECGKKIEEEINLVGFKICDVCSNEIEYDSNYCVCCGNKVI